MTITTIKQLSSRLKAANKETVQGIVRDASAFCGVQLNEHRNADPISTLYRAIPGLAAKPKGVTQANFRKYAEGLGLELDQKTKVFRIRKGVNLETFDAAWFESFVSEPVQKSEAEKAMANLTRAVKQYREAGLSVEKIMDLVTGIALELETNEE